RSSRSRSEQGGAGAHRRLHVRDRRRADPVSGSAPTVALGALAGALLAMAAREAVLASPAAAAWLRQALEPLRRAGREGYTPSTKERRRLAALGAAAAILAGWLVGGIEVALPLSVAGPGIAAWAISSRRRRYRAAVE